MRETVADGRTTNQLVGMIFGAVYVVVGLAGFAVTGGVEFAGREGDTLFGVFELNPLHNLVHLAIGAALLFGALTGPMAARTMNMVVGGSYLLVGLAGLFVLDEPANVLALNGADNVLHLGSAAILLGAGLLGASRTAVTGGTAARGRARAGSRH